MGAIASTPFDRIAAEYDAIWTKSVIGQLQRAAVWRRIDPLIKAGDRVLDLGCGTGEDASHFMQRGAEVQGIDASEEMVRIARNRGVNARQLAIESLSALTGRFDGAISNFGPLNCVSDLEGAASALARLIRPGGYLAICVLGACCAWELTYFLLRADMRKAFRRWRRGAQPAMGIQISYRSVSQLSSSFRDRFKLIDWCGIGICIPPSYVKNLPEATLACLAQIDERIAGWPGLRSLADHQLLLFERL